jgi:hypothetical protein
VAGFDASGAEFYGTYVGGLGDDWSGGICAVGDRLYTSGGTRAVLQFPTNAPTIPGHSPYLETASSTAGDIDGYFAQLRYDLTLGLPIVHGTATQNLLIFPNPATASLSVSYKGISGPFTLQVFDATSRLVDSRKMHGVAYQLNIASLPPGVYSLLAIGLTECATGRFIKE